MKISRWPLLALAFTSQCPATAYSDNVVGQATIIDGDTIEIHNQRIRMAGIDAPESRQLCINAEARDYRCGKVAAFALADQIAGAAVSCIGTEYGRYGRLVATCSARDIDLSSWMVEYGYAVAYLRYSTTYVEQEKVAKGARRGVWAGQFEMPWDWRKGHR